MVKGEIWWANLPVIMDGSEPSKRRPVLVVQSDEFNKSAINTTICVGITSNTELAKAPANILLEKGVSGLKRSSVANFSQLFTLDKSRLTNLVSMLPKSYISRINASIREVFDAEA
jgi:mRNA interferase MazF